MVIRMVAWYHPKAQLWWNGRQNTFQQLSDFSANADTKIIWVHCSSLGEFEQGRPLLEAIKQRYPNYELLLTFFSPSGYEVQKNYPLATWVLYLPMDSPRNARWFLKKTHPELVIFIKYDFWYYYLSETNRLGIPLLLVSGIFRSNQLFFKWYGAFYRTILKQFRYLFVQDAVSESLLQQIGIKQVQVAGDTRYDRVQTIMQLWQSIDVIDSWLGKRKAVVAGSTWPQDDEVLAPMTSVFQQTAFIIAPHNVHQSAIDACKKRYPNAQLFSEWRQGMPASNVLIIDNVGMLSRLYRYGTVCYVGGGFGKDGVHNVLEAAVYSKPVCFGPVYNKYIEAIGLVACEGARSVTDSADLQVILTTLLQNEVYCTQMGDRAADFVAKQAGATGRIMQYIYEKRLLTN
jgi:3-deoxy-D-manno-octulosonic-acid transferase